MGAYILRRVLLMIPTILAISVVTFIIIQLPPGDYLETMIAELQAQGERVSEERIQYLREQYGLDRPMVEQYFWWILGILQGDFGFSFEYNLPVLDVIGDAIILTALVNLAAVLFIWAVSFPIALYSATNQYSIGDYSFTFIGFLGLATPNFLLGLVLLYLSNRYFGTSFGGLMAPEYLGAPWSLEKVGSIMAHLAAPMIVIGTSGTAAMIRRLRANLLDELQKQYVTTARAKGLPGAQALLKYPLRVSLNPFVADIGSLLPQIISGSALVGVVMSLPIMGPILVRALQSQDMYLAGSILLLESILVVVGLLVSDILLAMLDPRIRLQGGSRR